ncbi:unnamed protein product [Brassicogethes aeneus]|uniref:TERF2-interacting telomeric protein 1 Myb domain-containing protein n=1 Tax=Brassicogethes aeneus TaxID=1431903 RepID=A0A9P0AXX0_BRAAE|nr:unnamed protein product [Brassicogethes aeneus]
MARPYTNNEKKKIVEFIIREKGHYNLQGNLLWKAMEKEFDRTWQGLKEHFKKQMFPKLIQLDIDVSKEELAFIKLSYIQRSKVNTKWDKELEECARILDYKAITKETLEREKQERCARDSEKMVVDLTE